MSQLHYHPLLRVGIEMLCAYHTRSGSPSRSQAVFPISGSRSEEHPRTENNRSRTSVARRVGRVSRSRKNVHIRDRRRICRVPRRWQQLPASLAKRKRQLEVGKFQSCRRRRSETWAKPSCVSSTITAATTPRCSCPPLAATTSSRFGGVEKVGWLGTECWSNRLSPCPLSSSLTSHRVLLCAGPFQRTERLAARGKNLPKHVTSIVF